MRRNEYEQRKRILDEQLRTALDLVHAGHRAQLQMLELLWRTSEGEAEPAQAAESPEALPLQETSPLPPKKRREAYSLYNEVVEALPQLPEDFTKHDVIRCLGYSPDRASLFRVLDQLQREGVLEMKQRGTGKIPTIYHKKHNEASQ